LSLKEETPIPIYLKDRIKIVPKKLQNLEEFSYFSGQILFFLQLSGCNKMGGAFSNYIFKINNIYI
jgi:hypothetical protein